MENGPKKDALFKGLWVAEKSPTLLAKELPVLSLDFSTLKVDKGGEQLEVSLLQKLKEIAQGNDITLDGLDLPNSEQGSFASSQKKQRRTKWSFS